MNAAIEIKATSGLSDLISIHKSAREEADRLAEIRATEKEVLRALQSADRIYDMILDLKVTSLAIGAQKARYLLDVFEEDCPQAPQIKRVLEAMI